MKGIEYDTLHAPPSPKPVTMVTTNSISPSRNQLGVVPHGLVARKRSSVEAYTHTHPVLYVRTNEALQLLAAAGVVG